MLGIGQKFPAVLPHRRRLERPGQGVPAVHPGQPTRASGRSCSSGRRTSPSCARPRSPRSASSTRNSRRATRSCSASASTASSCTYAWRSAKDELKNLPFPMLSDIKRELTTRARHPRPGSRRRAARDVHRRSAGRHPLRLRHRSERRPQPGGSAARARCAADRRAVPVQLEEGRRHPEGGLSNQT